MPQDGTPVSLVAELVPLAISDVQTDAGGASKYVTANITGAGFSPQAIVKLVRPGFAEYEPVAAQVVDATRIIAEFDLTDAPHGLYDLTVTNPDGSQAIIPYRFLVTRTVEPEVTIGVGGPRDIFAGDTGTYSVALQNLGNVDAPYTFFTVGVPELGTNIFFYGLKYLTFESNVAGAPDAGGIQDLPWATLNSSLNLDGTVATSGYLLNEPAGGFTGFTFNVDTYPGLRELHDHDGFDKLKAVLYAMYPDLAAEDFLKDGPDGLDLLQPGLSFIWNSFGAIPDLLHIPLIPFQFNIVASATSMTRDEFIAQQLQEADRLRDAIIADPDASPALSTLAADQATWEEMYLASLEETGLLLPDGTTPPVPHRSKDRERRRHAGGRHSRRSGRTAAIDHGQLERFLRANAYLVRQYARPAGLRRRAPTDLHQRLVGLLRHPEQSQPDSGLAHLRRVQPGRVAAHDVPGVQRLRSLGRLRKAGRGHSGRLCHQRHHARRHATFLPAESRPVLRLVGSVCRRRLDKRAVHDRNRRLRANRAAAAVYRQLPERPVGDHLQS